MTNTIRNGLTWGPTTGLAMRKTIVRTLPEPVTRILRGSIITPLHAYFRYFPLKIGKGLVWKYVCGHLWWLETHAVAKTHFGSILNVDARDTCGRFIYYFGIWEPHITTWMQGCLKPGDTFIDVGANIGYYSLLAADLVGREGKVVSIEAVRRTFDMLNSNVNANKAANVRPVNAAVWDRQETLTIFIAPDTVTGTSTLIPAWAEKWHLKGRCEVAAFPLCRLLESEEIRLARLIKIDVEGAEWRVISGMAPLLKSGRKDLEVIIEVATKLEVEGRNYRDIFSFFFDEGFFPYSIENDYSADSYIANAPAKRPKRMETVPSDVDQIDVIFSRTDAASL
jgi:FkbM family methyltransferase